MFVFLKRVYKTPKSSDTFPVCVSGPKTTPPETIFLLFFIEINRPYWILSCLCALKAKGDLRRDMSALADQQTEKLLRSEDDGKGFDQNKWWRDGSMLMRKPFPVNVSGLRFRS